MATNNEAELALANSPNLRSIQARLWRAERGFDFTKAVLKRLIALAPNLESVDVSESGGGCVAYTRSDEQAEEEERLERLFEVSQPLCNKMKSLKTRGRSSFYLLKDLVEFWRIERLDIDHVPYARFFWDDGPVCKFKSLKHLSVSLSSCADDSVTSLRLFLSSCNPLWSLLLENRCGRLSLPMIFTNNGATLRTLSLHEWEIPSLEDPRDTVSLSRIEEIRQWCSLLEDFTIDMDRCSSPGSKRAILSKLAEFPRLLIVGICFDLGIAEEAARTTWEAIEKAAALPLPDEEDNPELFGVDATFHAKPHQAPPFIPFGDSLWLENMWLTLGNEKRNNRTLLLEELHVKFGEWKRQIVQWGTLWERWEEANRRYYIVRPSERNDRPDEIRVSVMVGREVNDNPKRAETRRVPTDLSF
jgi:hypothetical protein